jgi:hypothetical protein
MNAKLQVLATRSSTAEREFLSGVFAQRQEALLIEEEMQVAPHVEFLVLGHRIRSFAAARSVSVP